MRARPERLMRLPDQYFADLMRSVRAAEAAPGLPLVDLGRGDPEGGPPPEVLDELARGFARPGAHRYAPFRGLPRLREAIARRYGACYGVELDPEREVAVVPGTKTAIIELALALGERGDTILLPDPGYPDYRSGVALAGARIGSLPLDPASGWQPSFDDAPEAAACYLNFPSNPCTACAADGVFEAAVAYAERSGAALVHDAAYIDLVFDGRAPTSFLATPGARALGVELWSMSKSFGMAGWRIGFVVGNAELVERINLVSDHVRVGMLAPLQHAAARALEEPGRSVEERRDTYARRRDRFLEVTGADARCEGSFFVWVRLPEGATVERLLREQRVVVAPGEGFGAGGAGYARVSLAVADEVFEEGLARLAPVLATVKR